MRADVRAQPGNSGRRAAARQPGRARGAGTSRIALTTTQRTIAQRMSESRAEIPDFTVEAEIDMEAARTGCASDCASRAASRCRRSTISSSGLPRSHSGSSRA